MKKILVLLTVICYSTITYSQSSITPVAPKNTLEETMSDSIRDISVAYAELEPNIIADIDWLNDTPIKEQKSMRDDKMRFILMWMTGSPASSVQIDDRIVTFLGADPLLLFTYMTGWTKYSLTHNHSNDAVACSEAAIKDVVAFYKKNKQDIKKNKQVEAYSALIDQGRLTEYINNALSKP